MPPKRTSKALQQELEAAKKVLDTGMRRSLEYKEAQKFWDEHGDKYIEQDDHEEEMDPESDADGEDAGSEEEEQEKTTTKGTKRKPQVDNEDEEVVAHFSKKPTAKKQPVKGKKRVCSAESDEDEGTATTPKPKKGKADKRQPGKNYPACVRKDYAVPEVDDNNFVVYEALVGGGHYVRLSNWVKNEKWYIQIRKTPTSGVNMPIEYLAALKKAVDDVATTVEKQGLLENNGGVQ